MSTAPLGFVLPLFQVVLVSIRSQPPIVAVNHVLSDRIRR